MCLVIAVSWRKPFLDVEFLQKQKRFWSSYSAEIFPFSIPYNWFSHPSFTIVLQAWDVPWIVHSDRRYVGGDVMTDTVCLSSALSIVGYVGGLGDWLSCKKTTRIMQYRIILWKSRTLKCMYTALQSLMGKQRLLNLFTLNSYSKWTFKGSKKYIF